MRHVFFALWSLVVAVAAAPAVAPLAAQQGRLQQDVQVRATPTGNVVATLRRGTTWATGTARDGFTLVTIQGWVESSRFAGARDSFPVTIGGSNTLRIRAQPSLNAQILGEFEGGAGLTVLERRANWARIRREVWAPTTSIMAVGAAPVATNPTPATPTRPAPTPDTASATPAAPSGATAESTTMSTGLRRFTSNLRATSDVPLQAAPGGATLGTLQAGTVIEAQGRDRGWVKVRVEAWVPESALVPADTAYGEVLTAADLRLDPQGTRGKIVRWEVQVAGLQRTDPLRRDMESDESFLLAMGPTGEDAILYIVVPQSLMAEARAISAMQRVTVTARVRTGRSNPTGHPILDLISIIK